MDVGTQLPLASPPEWDRFNRLEEADLSAVVGTPGISQLDAGQTLELLDTTFGQETQSGFFLTKQQEGGAEMGAFESAEEALQELGAPSGAGVGLTTDWKISSETGTHLRAQQTIDGAPVVGAQLYVHADGAGAFALTGRPLGDLEQRRPAERPTRSSEEVADTVREIFGLAAGHEIHIEEVVFPVADAAVWAYRAVFSADEPVANVRAYLDAEALRLLLSHNVASTALSGRARVFPVNPLRTPDPEDVDLNDLGSTPAGQLSGDVVTIAPGQPPPLSKADRDFRLGPQDQGFDQAQGYYHVWHALEYFGGLMDLAGFSSPPFRPVHAIVNDLQSRNNAFFEPNSGRLRFGDFAGPRPTARSADIVYHELGHAFTDAICALGRGLPDSQARGLSEGYSDYFAASALDDPRIGDYVVDEVNGARNCGTQGLRFAADFEGEEHATGEVWASVLWSIRGQIGRQDADKLVVGSVEFLNPMSTFEEGRSALVAADRRLFPGSAGRGGHETLIDKEFDARRP